MSGNSFGTLFTLTTFGESHGPADGCIVDGCPPGLKLCEADLQHDLDRRRPGTSRHTTQRREEDIVRILSGVFEGRTTGTPIGLLIENTDQRAKDYSRIMDQFRPGHADYTYQQKYGFRDYRGAGGPGAGDLHARSRPPGSPRNTSGSADGIVVRGYLAALGPIRLDLVDWDAVDANPFFCPDPAKVPALKAYMDPCARQGIRSARAST